MNVASDTASELWHKRLCHMSEKWMRKLVEGNLIQEMKDMHLEKCTDLLDGKRNRTPFQTRPPMRWNAPLELVHTDVCQVDTKSSAILHRDVHTVGEKIASINKQYAEYVH